jgi:hypothetical protein
MSDTVLQPGGSIGGTVHDETSGLPVAGVEVRVFFRDEAGRLFFVNAGLTDEAGAYVVHGLPLGDRYVVGFFPQGDPDAYEFYSNRHTWENADLVSVGPGSGALTVVDVWWMRRYRSVDQPAPPVLDHSLTQERCGESCSISPPEMVRTSPLSSAKR